MKYRRVYQPGGIYFFTLVTHKRARLLLLPGNLQLLWAAIEYTRKAHPFEIIAHVIMPEHLHMIWQLPEGDSDYSTRWRLLKSHVTRYSFQKPFWQNRFWEHTIRDEKDLEKHIDYIHYNPVKHGLVERPNQWEHSSLAGFLEQGAYSMDWGSAEPKDILLSTTGE